MPAGKVDRNVLSSNYQQPGDIYQDGKTEGAFEVIAQQVDNNWDAQAAHKTAAVLDHPDGSVQTRHIAPGAINGDKVANGTITADKFVAGALQNETQNGLEIVALKAETADQTKNPRSFGAVVNQATDDTAAVNAAVSASIATDSYLLIPHKTRHSVSYYNDNVRFFRKQNVSSKLPLAREIFKNNPNCNFHFIGDSITAGAVADYWWIPTKMRENLGYANYFGYGIQRYGTFEKDKRTSEISGVTKKLSAAAFANLIDFGNIFNTALTPNGIAVYYQAGGDLEKATYTISGGELSIFLIKSADFPSTIKTEVSINNSAWFSPKVSDGVTVEGFSNPASLDFTGVQPQVIELKVKAPKHKLVKFRIWTDAAGSAIYYPNNFARYGNAVTINTFANSIAIDNNDTITDKVLTSIAENEFYTITINYVRQQLVENYFNVKFIKNDGTLISPSAIIGLKFFDSEKTGTIDQVQQLNASTVKWNIRSYFMDDKTKLSDQGIIGVVLNENISGLRIHNIAFHGLVNNAAMSGITTLGYFTDYLPAQLPYIKPGDYVFINLGMNDWILQTGTISNLKNAYRNIITDCKNKGANVVMITPNPPIFSLGDAQNSDYRTLNFEDIIECIYDVVNESNSYLIDTYSMFRRMNNFNSYMYDNVHPNNSGHSLIAREMLISFGCKIN